MACPLLEGPTAAWRSDSKKVHSQGVLVTLRIPKINFYGLSALPSLKGVSKGLLSFSNASLKGKKDKDNEIDTYSDPFWDESPKKWVPKRAPF